MSLTNIKAKSQGFTIVELLIVVVVIAILAAITIVSYNGITNRANASAAQATASSLQKKAELYAADGPTSQYPEALTDLTSAASSTSYYVASGSINTTSGPAVAPTSSNGKDTVQYQPCGTFSSGTSVANMTAVQGANIVWYDFQSGSTQTLTIGDVSGDCATS